MNNAKHILHIEDLPLSDFIKFFQTLRKNTKHNLLSSYSISEKIDGSAIGFGMDNDRFYTNRGMKNSERYYSESDYPLDFWAVGFRSAHKALELLVKPYLQNGDSFVAEMLFGKLPNTVLYNGENKIVILNNNQVHFAGACVVWLDTIPYTDDGRDINFKDNICHMWSIATTQIINNGVLSSIVDNIEFKKALYNLYVFLRLKNKTFPSLSNRQIFELSLNKCPDYIEIEFWKNNKEQLKQERDDVSSELQELKLIIKEILLNCMVRPIKSKFGDSTDSWIEGVVIKHNNELIKVVDKDVFTKINKWNFAERIKINSVYSNLKQSLAVAVGHKKLALSYKKYMSEFGNTYNDQLENISKTIDINCKSKMINEIDKAIFELNECYDEYTNHFHTYVNHVNVGTFNRTFVYEGPIDQRTREVYADLFNRLRLLKQKITDCQKSEDLVLSIINKIG